MKQQKQGLWAIISDVKFEIIVAMIISSFGTLSLILSLMLLAFTLCYLLLGQTLVLFDIKLDLLNTILLLAVFTSLAFLSKFVT